MNKRKRMALWLLGAYFVVALCCTVLSTLIWSNTLGKLRDRVKTAASFDEVVLMMKSYTSMIDSWNDNYDNDACCTNQCKPKYRRYVTCWFRSNKFLHPEFSEMWTVSECKGSNDIKIRILRCNNIIFMPCDEEIIIHGINPSQGDCPRQSSEESTILPCD